MTFQLKLCRISLLLIIILFSQLRQTRIYNFPYIPVIFLRRFDLRVKILQSFLFARNDKIRIYFDPYASHKLALYKVFHNGLHISGGNTYRPRQLRYRNRLFIG